jgi:hypothetical protein
MSLAAAVDEIIESLRRRTNSASGDPGDWKRIVGIIAAEDSLPEAEKKIIEKPIETTYARWSDDQRRSIWYETDSGMTDDDDDESSYDTSYDGIGYALQVELLDEVMRAAWESGEELKAPAKKRRRRSVAK